MMLKVRHFQDLGVCARGLRQYMVTKGVEPSVLRKLREDGVPLSDAEAFLPDPYLERAIQKLHEERDSGS